MSTATAVATTALLVGADLVLDGASTISPLADLVLQLGFDAVLVTPDDLKTPRPGVALCIVDLRGNGEALRAIRLVRGQHPTAVIVGLADAARPSFATDAIRAGAFDVLARPAARRDLETILVNAREQAGLTTAAHASVPDATTGPYGLICASPAMTQVAEIVKHAASGRCGILICGERGTGRETIARAIHSHGPDPSAPFIVVNCAEPTPIELELFGTPSASTRGGDQRGLDRMGADSRLLEASGGILFLEHITEMPSRTQARLMRVLRDREVFIDDSDQPVALDVRPIASVDMAIEAAVEDGRIRAELFERLSLIRIDVPPLRMRKEDIPALASHLLKSLCRENGRPIKTITRSALTLLSALPWRGNGTELRGLLERLILLVPNGLIRLEDVLAHTQLDAGIGPTGADATLRQARARFERDYIGAVLQHHHGRVAEAARVLGIQRTNLYRKMRRLHLMGSRVQGRHS